MSDKTVCTKTDLKYVLIVFECQCFIQEFNVYFGKMYIKKEQVKSNLLN